MNAIQLTSSENLQAEKQHSYWAQVFAHLKNNKLAMVSAVILVILVIACILVPIFSSHDIVTTNSAVSNSPPSAEHWFGTDHLGRDLFVRFFYAGRISMTVALAVTFFTCLLGVVLGCISGFYGKFVDTIIQRLSEIFMSIPFLVAIIVVVGFFGGSLFVLVAVFSVLSWPGICRIVRGQILALRELEYMQACEALGLSDFRRIFRHLLPNVMAYVIVYATLSMGSVILTESALSFLGLGIAPPTPSWGNMIQAARAPVVLMERWWIWVPSGVAIFAVVMCFNLIGDGLRDAIDPKMKR